MAQATGFYDTTRQPDVSFKDLFDLRNASKKQYLDQIFAANIAKQNVVDPNTGKVVTYAGDLNNSGFYKAAADAGLGPSEMQAAMQYRAAQNQADAGQQQSNQMLRLYGADPAAAGRNGAQIGEPGIGSAPNPSAGQPTSSSQSDAPSAPAEPSNRLVTAAPPDPAQAPQTTPTFADYFQKLKASAQAARDQPAQAPSPALGQNSQALAQLFGMRPAANGNLQAPTPAPEQGSQDIHGEIEINPGQQAAPPSPTMQLPPPVVAQSATVPVQLPDTRDARQAVEDSYDPSRSMAGIASSGARITDAQIPPDSDKVGLERYRQGLQAAGGSTLPVGASHADIMAGAQQVATQRSQKLAMAGLRDPQKMTEAFGAMSTLGQELASELDKGGIGQMGDIQSQHVQNEGNARANQTQDWTVQGRQAVQGSGLDPAKIGPDQAVSLIARKNTLDGLSDLVNNNGDDLRGENGPNAQRAAIITTANDLAQIENVGTEAGNARLNTLLEFAPGLQKAVQEGGIQALPGAFTKMMASDPDAGYAALQKMVTLTKRDGILVGQLRAAGMKNPYPSAMPPKIASKESPEYRALKSGEQFYTPDGVLRKR